jgi:hypothetical protein
MTRFSIRLRATWLVALATAALPMLALAGNPILESTTSGLLTFSSEDKALRVAIVFAEQDDAVVPTLVRFIDSKGAVIKQTKGELRADQPVMAQLTRSDVGARPDLLVRVEVLHELPGARVNPYPILVTTQPLDLGGAGRFLLNWNTGGCGCPTCGPPIPPGSHVNCEPQGPTDI